MKTKSPRLENDLGSFEGFCFTTQCAVSRLLSAEEVLAFPQEAEFWPSGDNPLVAAFFAHARTVSPGELLALDQLFSELDEQQLLCAVVLAQQGYALSEISAELLDEHAFHAFEDTSFIDARSEAAHALFELYWPDAYRLWESGAHPDGLYFDAERFLESPQCSVTELAIGDRRVVIVEML